MTSNRSTLEANMTKQAADTRSRPIELSEQQLDHVAGGTKKIDKSSAKLFNACATGEHIKSATIVC
jgi:type VI protein secretion system component Hcp